MIRLVVADDHAIVRYGLQQILNLMPDVAVVAAVANGNEVLEILGQHTVDVILLDLNMDGICGAPLIEQICLHHAQAAVLVLTLHDDVQVAKSMIAAGACGFVVKDCDAATLMSAIRRVAAGGRFIAPQLAEKMVFATGASAPRLPHDSLSEREHEILRHLIAGIGVNAIAERLAISNKTVSTHKTRLMTKMNVSSMAELMRYAIAHNLPPD